MISPLFDSKFLAREKAKAIRRDLVMARPDAAKHAARVFMDNIPVSAGQTVALYHTIGDEINTGPLAAALHDKAVQLALPVVVKKKSPMIFRVFDGSNLIEGRYGIAVPPEEAPEVIPDIIVVPLLAFKKNGARLGMGGGYYDRTLAHPDYAKAPTIGYAYGGQEDSSFPVKSHDRALDWIITERGAYKTG
jgi:5-formyltetrahydrofolate cyclo-ligase